jgi:ubiquinone biosynthesis protein
MGSLSKADQQYLARNLLAIFKRDYRKVAELHVECGWVPADTPINAFESTMRSVCEPIFEKPLKDISFGLLLLQLFRTASRFNMEVQPSLVLLQKTLLNIEGLGKQLYPDLDLWQTALPFLEDWQKRRLSPWENLKVIQEKFPEWIEKLPDMPELIFDALTQGKQSQQNMQDLLKQHEKRRREEKLQQSRRQLGFGLIAILIAILISQPTISGWIGDLSVGSLILVVAGISIIYFRK